MTTQINAMGRTDSYALRTSTPHSTPTKLRPGAYNLQSRLPGGQSLLVNCITRAIDLVPTSLAEYLTEVGEIPEDFVDPPQALLDYLALRGYVTNLSPEEERTAVRDLATRIDAARAQERATPTFTFVLTYGCNLACTYCFQSGIEGRARPSIMSPDLVVRYFRYIDTFPHNQSKQNIELFGGEPLMKSTRKTVETIVKLGVDRGYTFTATTNGVQLDHFRDLLSPTKIARLLVTLDGPREIHDARRINTSGHGTFARIVSNIKAATDEGVMVSIRTNVDRDNLAHLPAFIDSLDEVGLLGRRNVTVFAAPVKPSLGSLATSELLSHSELIEFLSRDRRLLALRDEKNQGSVNSWDFSWGEQSRYCGAVSSSLLLDPEGLVFTCNEVVGQPEHAVGQFRDDTVEFFADKYSRWRKRSVVALEQCLGCQVALVCAGGCAIRGWHEGSAGAVDCGGFKEAFLSSLRRQFLTQNPQQEEPDGPPTSL